MRPAPTLLNIPPKLYKHFAIITVAITACAAIFVDGGTQVRIEQEIAERQAKSAAVKAEAAKVRNRRTIGGLQDNRTSQSGGDYVEAGPAPSAPLGGGSAADAYLEGGEPAAPRIGVGAMPPLTSPRGRKRLPPVLPPGAPSTAPAANAAVATPLVVPPPVGVAPPS